MKFQLYKSAYGIMFYSFFFESKNIESAIKHARQIYQRAGLIGRCYIQTDGVVVGSIE